MTCALLIFVAPRSFADSHEIRNVWILQTFDSSAAPFAELSEVFTAELQRRSSGHVSFTEISLDSRWGNAQSRENLIVNLLRNREEVAPPDLIVAFGPSAIRFWVTYRDSISPQTHLISVTREGPFTPADFRSGDAGVWTEFSFSPIVDEITRLRPATSHVVFVFGSSLMERALSAQAQFDLEATHDGLTYEFTNDLTLLEVQTRLGELPDDAAVFYGVFNVDAAGIILRESTGLSVVRGASRAPVFGAFDSDLGAGIVGGRLIRLRQVSLEAASVADSILRDEPIPEPWQIVNLSDPVYDWRELQKWDIGIDRLPVGSDVRFQPISMWERYTGWIVLAVAVVGPQTMLIVSLLTQRRRRRRAELANIRLSGMLINAHEDERRLVARELHDDLSQRLARLSIDAAAIRHDASPDALDAAGRDLRGELARISEDVHDISYRLHPSLVDDLGIPTALKTECDRIRNLTDIEIEDSISEMGERISSPVALCIYRIAQEALNNVIKHADAHTVQFAFDRIDDSLELKIDDDGRGFEPKLNGAESSLGLLSMRERARMLNGTLEIRSTPGSGTTIHLIVPLDGVVA